MKFLKYLRPFAKSIIYTNNNVCSEAFGWEVETINGIFQSRLVFCFNNGNIETFSFSLVIFVTWTFRDQNRDFHLGEFCQLFGKLSCKAWDTSTQTPPPPPFSCRDGNFDWIAGGISSIAWQLINYLFWKTLSPKQSVCKRGENECVLQLMIVKVTD